MVREEINEKKADIQARSFMARTLGETGKNAKLKEKQKWSHEKPHLDNARKLRGIYFIDFEVKELKETIKNSQQLQCLHWCFLTCIPFYVPVRVETSCS